jgi:hypothetical protein
MGATAPATATKLLPTIARGAGVGAAQGSVYGAGTGEGAEGTLKGAAIGGGLGLAAGAAIPAIGAGLKGTKNLVSNTFFQNADEKSSRIIREAAEQAGITPDDFVRKYTELGEGAIAADVDENLLKQAKVALNRFSPAKNAAREFVDNRQTKQQSDLLKSLSKHMGGTKSDDIYAALEKNQSDRAQKAAPLYKAAFDSDIDPSAFADKRIRNQGIQDALKEAEEYAISDVNRGGVPPKPVEKWHYAKKVLWDKAQALRATNPEKARLIDGQRKVVDDVLNTIPEYKQARTIWADSMDREAAAELGKGFIKANPREFSKEFSKLTDSEKEFAKMSAINDLANFFGAKAESRSVYQVLTDVPNARENLKTVLGSQDALDSFIKESKRWQAFGRTRKEFNQSTITQPLMSAEAQLGDIADSVSSPIRSTVMRLLKSKFSGGMDAETANALASKLTRPNLTADEARKLIEGVSKKADYKNALAAPVYAIQAGGAISNQ